MFYIATYHTMMEVLEKIKLHRGAEIAAIFRLRKKQLHRELSAARRTVKFLLDLVHHV
jgi:hypothetical protein